MERLLADAQKITGVKYDINSLSDVYNAIHAIQGKLEITGTTVKEAEGTFTGSFSAMKASVQDLFGAMTTGGNVQEKLQNLAETTSTFLFGNFLPMIGRLASEIPGALVGFIQEAGPRFLEGGKDLMAQLGIGMGSVDLSGPFQNLQQNIAPVFESIKMAVADLPALFEQIRQSIEPIIQTVANTIGQLDFSGISAFIANIMPAITNAFSTFSTIVSPAIEKVVQAFGKMWNALQPIWAAIGELLMPVLDVLASFLGGVFSGILESVAGFFDLVAGAAKFLTPVIQFLVEVFKKITPVLKVVAEWIGRVIGWFTNLGSAGKGLKGILNDAWGGIKNAIGGAKNFIGGAINGVKGFFTKLGNAGKMLKSAIAASWQGIKNAVGSGKGFISNAVNAIKGFFNKLFHIDLFSAGRAIIDGFLNGLRSAFGKVKDFIGSIGSWIASHKGPISVDRKLLIPAGHAIMDGLNAGLIEQFKSVKSTVSGMGNALQEAMGQPDVLFGQNSFASADMANALRTAQGGEEVATGHPVEIRLVLGEHEYKAYVADITKVQNEDLRLKLSY